MLALTVVPPRNRQTETDLLAIVDKDVWHLPTTSNGRGLGKEQEPLN